MSRQKTVEQTRSLRQGMTVKDADGFPIGKVTAVHGPGQHTQSELAYMTVEKTGPIGVVSLGGELYIPFAAIETINENEDSVTIYCSRGEADAKFKDKPSTIPG